MSSRRPSGSRSRVRLRTGARRSDSPCWSTAFSASSEAWASIRESWREGARHGEDTDYRTPAQEKSAAFAIGGASYLHVHRLDLLTALLSRITWQSSRSQSQHSSRSRLRERESRRKALSSRPSISS